MRWKWNCEMSSRRTFLALLAVLILLPGESLFADWYKDYNEALKLIEKKEWQGAVVRLQSALGASDDETASALHVKTRITYFPHFYLGLAYYNLKMYQPAISEFEKSEKDGAIRSRSTLVLQMSILKKLALEQIAKSTPANNEPPASTSGVHQPAQTPFTQPPVPETTGLQQKDSKKPPAEIPVLKQDQPPVELKPEPAPLVNDTILHDKLKQGARQYFDGNFDGAIASLKSVLQMDAQSASAHFLLGCAYASQYLLAGHENRQLLNRASDAFRKSRKIDPQFGTTHGSYMSPAVLRIYENVR